MTTDRIQPARPAAPRERPSQLRDGAGFAALLEVHAGSVHAPRRDEAARPDAPRDAARDDAPSSAAQHDGPRDAAARRDAARDDAPNAAAQRDGLRGEARSDVSSAAAETAPAAEARVATVPPVSAGGPIVDPLHPSLAGLPPAQAAPGGVAQHLAATGAPMLVTPVGAADVPAPRPAGAQPAGPAPVAGESFEATFATPGQPTAVAAQPTAPAAAVPAPAAQAAVPVATPAPPGTPVEGEAPVAAPVVAAPSPEPAAAPQALAPAVEPAQAEPQAAPTTSAGQPAPAAPAATTSTPERAVPLHRAPAAVATLLHVAAERGVTHARMALRPAELGGIEIRLQATAAGVAAQVVADSPEAARLLAQAGDDLRRALEAREVTLLSLEVSTSSEQRSREGARGERTGEAGTAPTGDHAAADAAESDVPTTHSVIELPGGLLVDVLA